MGLGRGISKINEGSVNKKKQVSMLQDFSVLLAASCRLCHRLCSWEGPSEVTPVGTRSTFQKYLA